MFYSRKFSILQEILVNIRGWQTCDNGRHWSSANPYYLLGVLAPSGWPSRQIVSESHEGDLPGIAFSSAAFNREQKSYATQFPMNCRASLGGIFSAIGPDGPIVSENSKRQRLRRGYIRGSRLVKGHKGSMWYRLRFLFTVYETSGEFVQGYQDHLL
jgi:hypothetical protein